MRLIVYNKKYCSYYFCMLKYAHQYYRKVFFMKGNFLKLALLITFCSVTNAEREPFLPGEYSNPRAPESEGDHFISTETARRAVDNLRRLAIFPTQPNFDRYPEVLGYSRTLLMYLGQIYNDQDRTDIDDAARNTYSNLVNQYIINCNNARNEHPNVSYQHKVSIFGATIDLINFSRFPIR